MPVDKEVSIVPVATRRSGASWTPQRMAEVRDLFLSRCTDDLSGFRPVVARSWMRSRAAGVDPLVDRGHLDEGRVDERTLRIAEPHLRKLDEVAQDIGGHISLSSPNGVLVKPPFLRDDDFPPGYSLLEASCGSNGEGVALEEGRAVWLSPEEHFREDMRGNWCFASLVRDPFHNRVRAVVGLTLPAAKVKGLDPSSTLLMLEGVTSRIERAIEAHMSSRESALLREYLTTSRRRGKAAVVVSDGKHSFMNAAATSSLDGSDLSVLGGYAKGVLSTGHATSVDVMLAGYGPASIEVSPVELPGAGFGTVAVVRPGAAGRTKPVAGRPSQPQEFSPPADQLPQGVDGQSISLRQTVNSVRTAVEQGRSVAVIGEPGSGKARIAETIAGVRGDVVRIDARERTASAQVDEACVTAEAGHVPVLLVVHADEFSSADARKVAARLQGRGRLPAIFTATSATEAVRAIADASGALAVKLAPLRRRREDIPLLAHAIASEADDRRLSRKLIATLTNSDWPGNVAQLRQVVSDAVERSRGIEVSDDDLPGDFHHLLTKGRLSRLEDAELVEIRAALREAKGNRRLAAEMLEIGRSTFYRRMDFFRSRGFDL